MKKNLPQVYQKWLRLWENCFWALALKEIRQILRDRKLLFLLLFPPTVQLLLYGFVLNPDVQYLKLGVVDYAQTNASRELISAFTENEVFVVDRYAVSQKKLGEYVRRGQIKAGLIIPPEFSRRLSEGKTATVQVLLDGVDANTAGIASSYVTQIVKAYNRQLTANQTFQVIAPQITFLYNPGLISSWFFLPAMVGVVLTLVSSFISSAALIREKETGTLEQLLMTPASTGEILLAKIIPLFVLLMGDIVLALSIAHFVFGVPVRGNFLLFLLLSSLYIFVGISIGMIIAIISRNQQQTILIAFFINIPAILISGAYTPIENMSAFLRFLSWFNPLRHYVTLLRGILLRGVGLEIVWPQAIFLLIFGAVLMAISFNKFQHD